jgi:hypothetical protein
MHLVLKTTKYRPATKYVILDAAAEESLVEKCGYLLLFCVHMYAM